MNRAASRPLRVLTLVDSVFGGAEMMALEIAANLDPERFDSTLCLSREVPASAYEWARDRLDGSGVNLLQLHRDSRFSLRPWARLVSYMRRTGVDVMHAHMFGSNVWGALLSRLGGASVLVAHEHTWSFEGQPLRRFLDRELIARRADAFVAVSEADRRRMHEIEGVPEAKLRFIPNGIPTPKPPDPARDVRAELGIAADQPVIGVVATLRPQKALDVLIEASVPLARRFPGLKVLIVGSDPDSPEGEPAARHHRLEALARSRGADDTVLLLGQRLDVPDLLAAFDVGVLTSDYEGSPLVVMEYMEAGKPVVATRVGGVPDLVEDGVTGLLVPPHDPAAFAAAVGDLLGDPERAAGMGAAGRARRRADFSIERTARQVEALYEELHAAKRR